MIKLEDCTLGAAWGLKRAMERELEENPEGDFARRFNEAMAKPNPWLERWKKSADSR